MKSHIFQLQNGSEVELNDIEMQRIHEYFKVQSTADYIRENYLNLMEEEVQTYAVKVRMRMSKCGCSEDEAVKFIVKKGGKYE